MPDPAPHAQQSDHDKISATKPPAQHDPLMDEEEKILAGRSDVNLPALLTRDVPGG